MAITPQIRVNGNAPRPGGLEANSQFTKGSTVALTLESTVGIYSFAWEITSNVSGATAAIASPNPSSPFNTTVGPLDAEGTYLLKGTPNGDPESSVEFAITVLASESSDASRIPARGEQGQWDGALWWFKAIRDAVLALMKRRIGVASIIMPADANYTVAAADYAKRVLYVTSAVPLTTNRDLFLPGAMGDPWWLVINATTGGQPLFVRRTGGGAGVNVSGQRFVVNIGNDFFA